MVRAIIAVIVGYLVSAILVSLTFMGLWMVLKPSFALHEGTLHPTMAWNAVALVTGFVAAAVAGFVTAAIAASPTNRPVKVLAGIILVLGLAFAIAHLVVDDPEVEPSKPIEEMTMFEAASETVAPMWYHFTIPVVGMVGVLLGGRMKGTGRSQAASVAGTDQPEAGP